jgi:hypothetical protein
VPRNDRFGTDHPHYAACMEAHRNATEAGASGYIDPVSGLFVMTASYLAGRACCGRACRHCPWEQ